jgi:NADPH-dependent 2,4-dienoyl-CoA reductase/sulfur reductase-like enzyme
VEVSAPNPRGRAVGIERLDGMTVERVDAHGKHLLLRFGDLPCTATAYWCPLRQESSEV